MKSPENHMLEFLNSVSSLYYVQKDHQAIALKYIDHYLSGLKKKYRLSGNPEEADLIRKVSEKTGNSDEEVGELFGLIRKIKQSQRITPEELKELVRMTERIK